MAPQETIREILTFDALSLIRFELKHSESYKDFLHAADEIVHSKANTLLLPEPIEVRVALNGDKKQDAENAIAVYEAIGARNPADAADPRLWTYLCFLSFRDYMDQRWPLHSSSNLTEAVRDHWLMDSPRSRSRVRNGLSRLWWVTHLTIDPFFEHEVSRSSGDQYAYTKWVFGNENRRQSLFERNLGRNSRVRWAAMETLITDNSKDASNLTKRFFRRVNLEAGFQRLELLPDAELKQLMERCLADSQITGTSG